MGIYILRDLSLIKAVYYDNIIVRNTHNQQRKGITLDLLAVLCTAPNQKQIL